MGRIERLIAGAAFAVLLGVTGCGDGNNNDNNAARTMPAPLPNTMDLNVNLEAMQVVGGGAAAGGASATFTVNLDDDTISGTVTVNGLTATAVNIVQGFAGENGTVLIALEEDSATEWSVTDVAFSDADLDALNAGSLYVEVITADDPQGALRGQVIVGDIDLYFTVVTGALEVPPVDTMASAVAATTVNAASGALVIHVNVSGLDSAVAGHIHQALAGANGGILIELSQDPDLASHWFAEDATLDAAGLDALRSGALYVNLHTPAHPGGEIRGQIQPEGIEIAYTNLTGGEVVPPVNSVNGGIAATTIDTASRVFTTHVNLSGLDDASGVTINQAPLGQNGPTIFTLVHDGNNMAHWSLADQSLTSAQYTALVNQGLYFLVTTPAAPDGEVRGQLQPAISNPGSGATFVVTTITPSNGAAVDALPAAIVATFNRDVLADSVSLDRVEVLAAGGDGAFGDAADLAVAVADVGVTGPELTLDLTGATNMDDVFQVTLDGTSTTPLTDLEGVVLDGDGDGSPGGDFVSTFTVTTPPMAAPTLTQIQAETFSVSCAVSGCHTGASPQAGMNLSAGQTFSNTVNVPSVEVPNLDRVEPGDPDNSYLVRKIEGNADTRMPLGQPPLPNQQIQNIRDWILDGAKNN